MKEKLKKEKLKRFRLWLRLRVALMAAVIMNSNDVEFIRYLNKEIDKIEKDN